MDAAAALCRTYTADTMTLDMDTDEFFITDKESLWKGESLYHLYEKAHTPWEWHKPIFDRCKELGILGFSTPFDDTAVDFLECGFVKHMLHIEEAITQEFAGRFPA